MRAPMGHASPGAGVLAGAVNRQPDGAIQGPGMQPPEEQLEPGQEAATPQEQQVYDQALINIVNAISGEEGSGGLFKMLDNMKDPVEGIGDAAVMLVENEDDNQQGALPDEVIAPLTMEVAERIATLANEHGHVQVNQDMLQKIGRYALAKLGDDYGNTPEDMMEAIGPELQEAGIQMPQAEPAPQGGPEGAMPQGDAPPMGGM